MLGKPKDVFYTMFPRVWRQKLARNRYGHWKRLETAARIPQMKGFTGVRCDEKVSTL